MKIFEKRPLSLILCIMLTVFSFSIEASILIKSFILVLSLTVFFLALFTEIFNKDKRPIVKASALACSFSIVISIIWSMSFFPSGIYGNSKTVTGSVTELNEGYTSTRIVVNVSEVDGFEKDFNLFFNCYYGNTPKVGDLISFNATLEDVKNYSNDGNYTYYYKDGITAVATEVTELNIIESENGNNVNLLRKTRGLISNILIKRTNTDTGGFLTALLVGDKSNLDPNTALSFRRLGISHILALSGMHLAIITHAIEKILRTLTIHKKARVIFTGVFTVFYMALVGFTPSITRSGVMLLIYFSLFLISRRHDSITSLFIAVATIVIFSPNSVFDISLWLSAFATLGVIISSGFYNSKVQERGVIKGLLLYCLSSFIASFFAISCTLIFSVIEFGTISVISILTTVIFSFPILFLIYAAMALLVFGRFIPFGSAVILLSDFIKEIANAIASPSWVFVSANFIPVRILTVIFTVCLFLFLIIEIKRKKLCITVLSVLFSSIFLLSGALTAINRYENTVYTHFYNASDTVIIKSQAKIYAIENGDTSTSDVYHILSLLTDEGASYIDELVLTTVSDGLNSIEPLINNVKVKTVRVPVPRTDLELEFCSKLSALLSKYGTNMKFYESTLEFGNYNFEAVFRTNYFANEQSEIIYTLKGNGESYAYLSSKAYDIAPYAAIDKISECKTIVLGYTGSNYKEFDILIPHLEKIIVIGKKELSSAAKDFYSKENVEIIASEGKYILYKK